MKSHRFAVAALFCAVVLTGITTEAYTQVTQQWVAIDSGLGRASSRAMAVDISGNIYIAAGTNDGVSVSAMLILKYTQSGSIVWSVQDTASSSAYEMVLDGAGNIYVVGAQSSAVGYLTKIDAGGTVLWKENLAGRSTGDIAVDEYGNTYVASYYYNASSQTIHEVQKFSASGILLWTITPSSNIRGLCYRDGYLYTHGSVYVSLGNTPGTAEAMIVLDKLNAANGLQIWSANYTAFQYGQLTNDIVVDEAGNVYLAGIALLKAKKSHYNRNHNWLTLKYNSAGLLQWIATYDGNADDIVYNSGWNTPPSSRDEATAITLDGSGNPCVTGMSYESKGGGKNSSTSHDITTIKYSASGTRLWLRSHDGPEGIEDIAQSIWSSPAGNVYVGGSINRYGNQNAIVLKYSSVGLSEWVAVFDGGSAVADWCADARLDNAGNVFLVGQTGTQMLLVKYSQSGTPKLPNGDDPALASSAMLEQNYPNPFNPSTIIRFSLPETAEVVLKVFNVLGVEVATPVSGYQSAGAHAVTFEAGQLESGVYAYTLTVNGATQSRTMLLLK